MERYTEKIKFKDGSCAYRAASPVFSAEDIIKRLCEYEDLEEQGRLKILPIKPGDFVYEIYTDCTKQQYIMENRVTDISITIHGIGFENPYTGFGFTTEDLGKTIFLSKEAAEAALKESEQE